MNYPENLWNVGSSFRECLKWFFMRRCLLLRRRSVSWQDLLPHVHTRNWGYRQGTDLPDRSYEPPSGTQRPLRRHQPKGRPKIILLSLDNIPLRLIIPMHQKSRTVSNTQSFAGKTYKRVNGRHSKRQVSSQTALHKPFKDLRVDHQMNGYIRHQRSTSYQQPSSNLTKIDHLYKGKCLQASRRTNESDILPNKTTCGIKDEQLKRIGVDNRSSPQGLGAAVKQCKPGQDVQLPDSYWLVPENKCSQLSGGRSSNQRRARLKTCGDEEQTRSHKRRNIIYNPQLVQPSCSNKEPNYIRIKTQHCLLAKQEKLPQYNNSILSISEFIVKSQSASFTKGIPGVKFKPESGKLNEDSVIQREEQKNSHLKIVSEYLHQDKLLEMDSISKQHELRFYPKQRHFYQCPKLSQLSLYRTNLRLSCDHWVLIDQLQLKYLRGWHPKDIKQFSVVTKLLIAQLLLKLQASKTLNIKQVMVRVNNGCIRNKVERSGLVFADSFFSLRNGTLITLWDLFLGVLSTDHEDLMWHLIYALGHIYKQMPFQFQSEAQELLFAKPIDLQAQQEKIRHLEQMFLQKGREVCHSLSLLHTSVQTTKKKMPLPRNRRNLEALAEQDCVFRESNDYQFILAESSCLDASILFLSCLDHEAFVEALREASGTYQAQIKYQVGYKFWQARIHTFQNECPQFSYNQFAGVSNRNPGSGNYSTIAFHLGDRVAVICTDSKTNMAFSDIKSIHSWMRVTFKRFRDKKGVSREARKQ